MTLQPLDLEALLSVPCVEPYSGFDFSPGGREVAFSWNRSGRWEVAVVPLSSAAPPRQVTAGPGGKRAPRYSPDGTGLAYALDPDGSESYEIWVCDLATSKHANVTPDTPGAIQPNFCWSPDGRWIAFACVRSDRFDTYVMPATGGEARPVLSLPYPAWEVTWSPNGRWLAVVAETHAQDSGTFVVPLEGGAPVQVADGSDPICARGARWSPDSSRLAFSSDYRGHFDIGVYELASGQVTWLTAGEGAKEAPAWSPDGTRLVYVLGDGPVTSLAVLRPGKKAPITYQVAPGVHYRPRFTPDGAGLVFVFDNPGHPCDLWLLNLADGSFRQLTYSLPRQFEGASFVVPESIRYPGFDGQRVPALLYRPQEGDDTLLPAVVCVHGGPNWLAQVTWDPAVQHMVSRGWAVLAPNYRGSTGYGREWQLANRFDLGGGDTQDVVAGADYLVNEGIADPARIAVTGRSWGGYLTMTCLTQYPDRWAGGSAAVPFLNWFTAHANSREDMQHWDLENFGDPEENHDLWYARSPFFFLDRVAAPVQLICGAHDVRCPASEALQARDRLAALGKRCDLVCYGDEGHSFRKIENVVDSERRRLAFLAGILEGGR